MRHGFDQCVPLRAQNIRKIHNQDAIRNDHTLQHHDSHERLNVERGAGKGESENHADESGGNRENDEKWVNKGSKLGDQDQVHKKDGQKKPYAKALEGRLHGDHEASDVNSYVRGQFRIGDDLRNCFRRSANVFAGRRDVNVESSLQLVMVHFSWRLDLRVTSAT